MKQSEDMTAPDDDALDDMLLTEEQIDAMMLQLINQMTGSDVRSGQTRTLINFTRLPYKKWPMPISYKFDGSHCE